MSIEDDLYEVYMVKDGYLVEERIYPPDRLARGAKRKACEEFVKIQAAHFVLNGKMLVISRER